MLLSRSPSPFAHSSSLGASLGAGCLAECPSPLPRLGRPRPPPPSPPPPPPPPQLPRPCTRLCPAMPVAAPRRPCLVVRAEEAHRGGEDSEDSEDPTAGDIPSPTRHKKRVVFADDKGLSLTQVRVMTEPSGAPPSWSVAFLEQVTRGLSAAAAPEPWEVSFPQPASDYLRFRQRLETSNVSLENVIVREAEEAAVGTVKVRNLCFQKEVLVRSSADGWATQEDAFCQFVQHPSPFAAAAGVALYDTFSFRLLLPPRSRRIEFCVCFRCEDGREFWDNNSGDNYVLVKKFPASGAPEGSNGCALTDAAAPAANNLSAAGKCLDALYAKVDAWSEFASWNHLVNEGPYW